MAKTATVTVTDCGGCPHARIGQGFGDDACDLNGSSIFHAIIVGTIPDWCPLPDAPKEVQG